VLCSVMKCREVFLLVKTVDEIIQRYMLELWLMPQLLQDKPNIFQHVGASSHFHSEVTTFLNRQFV
jgi:hypothetical protein